MTLKHENFCKMTTQQTESNEAVRNWARKLPSSIMVYPDRVWDRVKYIAWRAYIPLHPHIRDMAVAFDVVQHSGRQPFLLGYVAPHVPIKSFILHLIDIGYGNHFVAWHDDDEIISVRMTDGFTHQYHLRVFHDGAVHGHYEYTPEAHPFLHMGQANFEFCYDFFIEQFGELIIAADKKETATLAIDYYSRWNPRSRFAQEAKARHVENAMKNIDI